LLGKHLRRLAVRPSRNAPCPYGSNREIQGLLLSTDGWFGGPYSEARSCVATMTASRARRAVGGRTAPEGKYGPGVDLLR